MRGKKYGGVLGAAMAVLSLSGMASADVLRMSGNLTSLETVFVGDAGNAADRLDASGSHSHGAVSYNYNISKYEVTAGQYTEFLNAVARTDAFGLYTPAMWSDRYGCKIQRSGVSGSYIYSVAADYANRPVNYVTWGDAARFANWLHNGQPTTGVQKGSTTEDGGYNLSGATTESALAAVTRKTDWRWAIPTEDEWHKAAYYKGGSVTAGYWDYPTQAGDAPGRDMGDASGNNANSDGSPFPIESGKYYTTVVGEFQDSQSAYRTFDQGGNVWEWTEGRDGSSQRVVRGGSYWNSTSSMRAGSQGTYSPAYEYIGHGFRLSQSSIAAVPLPAAAWGGLVLLGGLALRQWRASRRARA